MGLTRRHTRATCSVGASVLVRLGASSQTNAIRADRGLGDAVVAESTLNRRGKSLAEMPTQTAQPARFCVSDLQRRTGDGSQPITGAEPPNVAKAEARSEHRRMSKGVFDGSLRALAGFRIPANRLSDQVHGLPAREGPAPRPSRPCFRYRSRQPARARAGHRAETVRMQLDRSEARRRSAASPHKQVCGPRRGRLMVPRRSRRRRNGGAEPAPRWTRTTARERCPRRLHGRAPSLSAADEADPAVPADPAEALEVSWREMVRLRRIRALPTLGPANTFGVLTTERTRDGF